MWLIKKTEIRLFQGVSLNSKVIHMSNLIEIQNQIEMLQKQAAEIRAQEFDKTVQDILAQMAAYGITVKDLEGGKPRGRKAAAGAPSATKPAAAKFRGPQGETWSGRGLMPRWLSALVAQGRTREEFAITN
jgi:DNA-binding protein H-NS